MTLAAQAALLSVDRAARAAAIEALPADPAGAAVLRAVLFRDESAEVRALAAQRLGRIRDPRASRWLEEALADWGRFLGEGPVVVRDVELFRAFWSKGLQAPVVLDLPGASNVLTPGRREGTRWGDLTLRSEPGHLASALAELVGSALDQEDAPLALLAHGLEEAWRGLRQKDPRRAAQLGVLIGLCEFPSVWSASTSALFPAHPALGDGRIRDAIRAYPSRGEALDAARPRWARRAARERRLEALSTLDPEERTLDPADRKLIDEIFQERLPRALGQDQGGEFRPAQHALAARIALGFGRRELALMHAPTGTGKTLAYLVPVLLWALRNDVRVGVATYTRALQEQAMSRDVPFALDLLRQAGVRAQIRVTQLKGRRNYLCWRALVNELPGRGSTPDEVLVWTALALFAQADPDGDLDRFPRRSPFGRFTTRRESGWRQAMDHLIPRIRSETGCCSSREDRETCAASAARERAERAHVVVTNHAFALARREFFRQVVFDECEHLHDVAHNAFSHAVPLREIRDLLLRLYREGGDRRHPLNHILDVVVENSPAALAALDCREAHEGALLALERLTEEIAKFKRWRSERASLRGKNDHHSLFREFAFEEEASELLDVHGFLVLTLQSIETNLAQISEHLDTLPARGTHRLRRSLELLRNEMDECFRGVEAWLPRGEAGEPAFRPETFYDLEVSASGEDVLAARVLLPHEYLGRHYYPDLGGAVFLSATTWLRKGFETSADYLGLTRAAQPLDDEEREPSTLTTFRVPETFDYDRVLVTVPRDAPPIQTNKQGFLDYVRRFTAYLAERTRGRILVLFTNAEDLTRTAQALGPFFRERHLPLYHQRMGGAGKEELCALFREQVDATLLGLDTFWYGADFPGTTLEYLILVRMPYGVPDRYHHAQCASLSSAQQRRTIYLPRALSKFRQGFGRLMRQEQDRGCVFVLDGRVLDPRHRSFLKELPVRTAFEESDEPNQARLVVGDTDRCLREAFAHMGMGADIQRRGLDVPFRGWSPERTAAPRREPRPTPPRPQVREEDIPF